MDKRKLFLIVSLLVVAAIIGLSWFFINRALNNKKPKKLLDKDFTKIEVRQAEDKNYKEAKKYFEKLLKTNSTLSRPTQEMARNAAYLANAKYLKMIYDENKKFGKGKQGVNWDDQQLLINASYYGNKELIKQLIKYKAEVEKKDDGKKKDDKKDKITVVHYAAGAGNFELVKYYVEQGMDLKAVDARGWNMLHFAAAGSNTDLIKYLVEEKGFDVNGKNKYGQTALDYVRTKAASEYLKSKGAKSGTELR